MCDACLHACLYTHTSSAHNISKRQCPQCACESTCSSSAQKNQGAIVHSAPALTVQRECTQYLKSSVSTVCLCGHAQRERTQYFKASVSTVGLHGHVSARCTQACSARVHTIFQGLVVHSARAWACSGSARVHAIFQGICVHSAPAWASSA